MTRFEQKPTTKINADDIMAWVKAEITNLDGVPISVKPTDDYTQVEHIDIGRTLTLAEKSAITTKFPELLGKEKV